MEHMDMVQLQELDQLSDVLSTDQIDYLKQEIKRAERKAELSAQFKTRQRDRLQLLKHNISVCRQQA